MGVTVRVADLDQPTPFQAIAFTGQSQDLDGRTDTDPIYIPFIVLYPVEYPRVPGLESLGQTIHPAQDNRAFYPGGAVVAVHAEVGLDALTRPRAGLVHGLLELGVGFGGVVLRMVGAPLVGQSRAVFASGQDGEQRIPLRFGQAGGIVAAVLHPGALAHDQGEDGVGHVVVGLGVIRFSLGCLDRGQHGFYGGQIIPGREVHEISRDSHQHGRGRLPVV